MTLSRFLPTLVATAPNRYPCRARPQVDAFIAGMVERLRPAAAAEKAALEAFVAKHTGRPAEPVAPHNLRYYERLQVRPATGPCPRLMVSACIPIRLARGAV